MSIEYSTGEGDTLTVQYNRVPLQLQVVDGLTVITVRTDKTVERSNLKVRISGQEIEPDYLQEGLDYIDFAWTNLGGEPMPAYLYGDDILIATFTEA